MVKVVLFTPANFSEMETAPSSPSKKTTLIISLKYLLNQVSYCLSFPYEWGERKIGVRCFTVVVRSPVLALLQTEELILPHGPWTGCCIK